MHTVFLSNHSLATPSHPHSYLSPSPLVSPLPRINQEVTEEQRLGDSKKSGRKAEKANTNCIRDLITECFRGLQKKGHSKVLFNNCHKRSKVSGTWLTLRQVHTYIRTLNRFLRVSCDNDSQKQETHVARERSRELPQPWLEAEQRLRWLRGHRWYQQQLQT